MKSYRFKLKPSPRIIRVFEQWLDACRELYNAGLQERRDAWKMNKVSVNFHKQSAQLPAIKEARPDIAVVHAQVLQNVLRNLSKTFDAFFRRIKDGETPGYPRFKGKNRYNSFTFPQARGTFWVEGKKLHLSKIGKVKFIQSREIEGAIKTCTIKREVDGWYVVFAVEEPELKPLAKTGKAIGIDLGLESFATLSDGSAIQNPKFLRESERRLKTACRSVSRKKKRGKNRKKAVTLLAKQHLKIKRQRRDFCFKTANDLVNQFDEIAVEDLQIANLVKNKYLSKSISDASWGTFVEILSFKAERAGRTLWKVDPSYTSQDCSGCGSRMKKKLSERQHKCEVCGLTLHRDHNAAINILVKGEGIAYGDDSVSKNYRVNHEPTLLSTGNPCN